MRMNFSKVMLVGLALLCGTGIASAAAFPDRPIQFIVPYSAGGATDLWARAIAQVAPRFFPVPTVVVNKAGGGAIPGRVDVVKSRPDGYTLLMGWGSGEDLVVPHQRQLPYDVFVDLVPVCRMSVHSIVMVVPGSSPHKDIPEFVKWAKTKEHVTAAVSTKGGSPDISMQLFAKAAGFKLTSIPGSGGADSMTRLAGGHVDISGAHPSEILTHVKAGRMRPLGVAFAERDPSAPDVPTFRERGIDLISSSARGFIAPKGTPPDIMRYLEQALRKAMEDPDHVRRMKEVGLSVKFMGSEEFTGFIGREEARAKSLIDLYRK